MLKSNRAVFEKICRRKENFLIMEHDFFNNSPLIINKPINYTSMDVVRIIKNVTGIEKVGHAGTLDPLATGVLIVCLGKDTKKIEDFMNLQKEYIAEIDLTAFSLTDDAEGPLTYVEIEKIPTQNQLEDVLKNLSGEILQTPPKYSATKINGVYAYKLARQGKSFKLNVKLVNIYEIKILKYSWPILNLKILCSRGTYIRSIARDIGIKLNTGGFLKSLQRTAIGNYKIENSIDIEQIKNINKYEKNN